MSFVKRYVDRSYKLAKNELKKGKIAIVLIEGEKEKLVEFSREQKKNPIYIDKLRDYLKSEESRKVYIVVERTNNIFSVKKGDRATESDLEYIESILNSLNYSIDLKVTASTFRKKVSRVKKGFKRSERTKTLKTSNVTGISSPTEILNNITEFEKYAESRKEILVMPSKIIMSESFPFDKIKKELEENPGEKTIIINAGKENKLRNVIYKQLFEVEGIINIDEEKEWFLVEKREDKGVYPNKI